MKKLLAALAIGRQPSQPTWAGRRGSRTHRNMPHRPGVRTCRVWRRAWVDVGDLDLFYDESVDYARRLEDAGVECELVTVPGMYHGADGLARKHPAMQAFHRGWSTTCEPTCSSPPC